MSKDPNLPSLDQIARASLPSELISAIDETPGLIVPILGMLAVFEIMEFRSLIPGSGIAAYTIESLVAVLAGLILYCGGNFWDSRAFDPRYGVNGTYLKRSQRRFGILPAGDELAAARAEAATLLGLPQSEKGAYSKSEDLLRRTGRWKEVLPSIVLSKVARSFIWPAFIAAVVAFALVLPGLVTGAPPGAFRGYLFFAGSSAMMGLLAFIPYFELRVKHMTCVYHIVASIQSQARTTADAAASAKPILAREA